VFAINFKTQRLDYVFDLIRNFLWLVKLDEAEEFLIGKTSGGFDTLRLAMEYCEQVQKAF
jgi:predicted peptidase